MTILFSECVFCHTTKKEKQRSNQQQNVKKHSGTDGETGAADLGPAEQVKQTMDAGQLAAHQPLTLHHAAGLPAMQVIDGCHHHHVCKEEREPDRGGEREQ